MKKSAILLLVLFLFPLASAIEFDMKTNYSQGETLLATFTGNFQNKITENNIIFYRDGHVQIPIIFELTEIQNKYYVYALLSGKNPGDYSISLENAKYYKQGEIVDDAIKKDFHISEDFADFSIKPGFVITEDDFSIEIQNLKDDNLVLKINKPQQEISTTNETNVSEEESGFLDFLLNEFFLTLTGKISLELDEQTSIEFVPGEIKTIDFKMQSTSEPTLKTIKFSSENSEYNLPVYIPTKLIIEDYQRKLKFNPSELKVSLDKNMSFIEKIKLNNLVNETLENITFEFSNALKPYLELSQIKNKMNPLSSQEIEIIFSSSNKSEIIVGELTAKIANETEDISITFEVVSEEIINPENLSPEVAKSKTCEELDGTICEEGQECSGEIRYAKDGNCCLDQCTEPEEDNTKLIIGWAIIIVIIIALIWFFKFKYKTAKGEVDLFKHTKS